MAWTYGNRYLTETEKRGNVDECEKHFTGWSTNARAAMYGNMDYESNINPGIYENLKVNLSKGYGLVQWTPASKVQNWLRDRGYYVDSGDGQCQRILYELANGGQWIPTSKYPQSFRYFTTATDSVEILTEMWARNYERPYIATMNLPERVNRANKWLGYLGSETPPEPSEPEEPVFPPEGRRTNINRSFIIMMIKRRKNAW